jgi:ribosome-associated protein
LCQKDRAQVSGGSTQHRHLGDRHSKASCVRAFHPLSRTQGRGRNYPPRKTLPGVWDLTAKQLATTCAELAANKKAEDIVVLDLAGISSFTDFFVICSANSEPQLKAIAGEIETRLREEHGRRAVAIDGFPASQWIVLDYLEVVVHIFHRDKRAFYSLEDLWGDATRVAWETTTAAR